MPGGGEAHGPQPRSYRQYTTKKARRLALKVALSDKVRHGRLIVVNDFAIEKYSTKQVKKILEKFNAPKTLLADERKDDILYKSARNLYGAQVLPPGEINAEYVLRHDHLIISETALTSLAQRLQETKE
jgi:large subunit ribosomal protein L4